MELEDAVHTAILTLKEGFEGAMNENSIEIGIITVAPPTGHEANVPVTEGGAARGFAFRKLSPAEVKDYLVNIA